MAISIQYWAKYTSDNQKLQRKSEALVAANHVLKFVYDVDNKFINSVVQASMRDRSYKVTVSKK